MKNTWLVPFKEIGHFVTWWAQEIPQAILRSTRDMLLSFDDSLQFGANLRLWLAIEPMFGDYTWSGRATGFLIRGLRVAVTLLVYVVVLAVGLAITLIWLALPLILLVEFQL